jgi:hypothetical protein
MDRRRQRLDQIETSASCGASTGSGSATMSMTSGEEINTRLRTAEPEPSLIVTAELPYRGGTVLANQ